MKKWGRRKIERELEAHGLTSNCIRTGLGEIDDADYANTLRSLIEKKWAATQDSNPFKKKDKVARHAIMKGFEPDLVWGIIKEIEG